MSEKLYEWIDGSERIVFFGGAGVSTESGIPDFRSVDGLYKQKFEYPPEEILSHSFFVRNPEYFYRFYREKMLYLDAQPNDAHKALAKLEQYGKLLAVITQNIDGLHQAAGSQNVLELHGSVARNYCMSCGKRYDINAVLNSNGVPRCQCGGVIRPDVVLYEEMLDKDTLEKAVKAIGKADLLIIGGTSLNVYPASGLVNYFTGQHLVIINRDATPFDDRAGLAIAKNIGEVLGGYLKR
ncbi:MAG: NAD-dependent protein deacylase [Christensenellaceae bacterium]|jgi:NAD-dependent deacetylase